MELSEAEIFNLQMSIAGAAPGEIHMLRTVAVNALAEEKARLRRVQLRYWAFNASVGIGSLFLLFASMLAALRLFERVSVVLGICIATLVVWLVIWLFNTHDRLNRTDQELTAALALLRLRRDALQRCVASANRAR